MVSLLSRTLTGLLIGALVLFAAVPSEAQTRRSNERKVGARPTRQAPPTRQARPQPRRSAPTRRTTTPSRTRTTTKSRSVQRRPQTQRQQPTRRTTNRSSVNTRSRSNSSNSSNRSRTSTNRRTQSTRRVPSVKRYQGQNSNSANRGFGTRSSSRSTTNRSNNRSTPTSSGRSNDAYRRAQKTAADRRSREAAARRANSDRLKRIRNERELETRNKARTLNDRGRSYGSGRQPLKSRGTAESRTRTRDNRNALSVSPLKRNSRPATNRGSGSVPSSGFGSNAGSSRRLTSPRPTTGSRTNSSTARNNRTLVPGLDASRSARRSADLSGKATRESARERTHSRTLRNNETLGRGGIAGAGDGKAADRRLAATRTSSGRPAALRRIGADQRSNVVQSLTPDVSRRLSPPQTRVADVRAGGGDSAGRGGDGSRGDHHHRQSSLNFGLFVGGGTWGLGFGYSDHNFYRGARTVTFGFGGGYCYSGSYFHTAAYNPFWRSHYYGVRPYHLGIASPAHVYFGHQVDFRYRTRLHFGYNYYHPFASFTPYPFYRTCLYEPWYVRRFARSVPAYRTFYYVNDPFPGPFTTYVETSDPFIEEEEVINVSVIDDGGWDDVTYVGGAPTTVQRNPIPSVFQRPFSRSVPDGQSYDESLAWAEEALFNGDYLGAAEAFRQAMQLRWDDHYPKFQLALALFGAERYDLAYLALELGLDQNPAWLYRRFDIRDAFASREEFAARVTELERYLIRHSANDEARFVLGYCYFFSGNLFGARSVTRILDDSQRPFPHLNTLAAESEKRLLREGR